ncbi:unnamed protein product [Amoebophrya sp. A25]|nr:unnamed protein product [Amoebophrya sp. A25]|eukprot:GSA25T00020747001.1
MFFFQEPPILRMHERARCRRQRRARLSALSSSVPGTLGVLSLFFSRCSSSLFGLFYAAAKQITRRDDGTAFDVELERNKRAGEGNSDEPNGVTDVQEDEDNLSTLSSFATISADGEVNLEPGKGLKDKALFDDVVDFQRVRTGSSFVSVGAAGEIFSDLKQELEKIRKQENELLDDELLQVQGEQLQGSAQFLEKLEEIRQTREEGNRILQKLKQLYEGRKVVGKQTTSTDNKNKELVVSLSAPWPQAQAQPLSVRLFSSPEGTAPFVALSVENREALANPLSKVVDQITVNHVLDAANAAHHQGGGQTPKYRVLFTQPGAISTSAGPLAITDRALTPEERTQYFNALENDVLRWSNQLILLSNIKQIYLEMCRYNYEFDFEYQKQFGEVDEATRVVGDLEGQDDEDQLFKDVAEFLATTTDPYAVKIFSVDNNDEYFTAAQFDAEIRGEDSTPEAVVREVVIQDITSTSGNNDKGLDFISVLNEVQKRVQEEVETRQNGQDMTLPASNCDRGQLQMISLLSHTVTCATTGKDGSQHGFRKFNLDFALACDLTARVATPPPSELQKQLQALEQQQHELHSEEEELRKQQLGVNDERRELQTQQGELGEHQRELQIQQEQQRGQQERLMEHQQELQNEEKGFREQRVKLEREREALKEEHRLELEELLGKRQHLDQERDELVQNEHPLELSEDQRKLQAPEVEQLQNEKEELQTEEAQLKKQRREYQEKEQELRQEQQELQSKREELARKHLHQQKGRHVRRVETFEKTLVASSDDTASIQNSNKLIEVVLQHGEQQNKMQVLKLRKLTPSTESELPLPFIDWKAEEHNIAKAVDAKMLNIQEVSSRSDGLWSRRLHQDQEGLPFYRFLFKQPGADLHGVSAKKHFVKSDEKEAYFTSLDKDPRNWSTQLSLLKDPQIEQIFAEMCRFNYNFIPEYAEQFRPAEQVDALLHVLKNKFNIDNADETAGGKQFSQKIRAESALSEQEVREVIVQLQDQLLVRADDNTQTDFYSMLAEIKETLAKEEINSAGVSRTTANEPFRTRPYTITCATRGEARMGTENQNVPFRKIIVDFEFDYDSQVIVRPGPQLATNEKMKHHDPKFDI